MKIIQWPEDDAYFNLAAEEYVFLGLDPSEEYLRLWQNRNAVIVGVHQNTIEEINTAYVKEHGIQIVRRITGGGAVYHDLGNLNFTLVMNVENSQIDIKAMSQPIIDALRKLGLDVQFSGRNDLLLDEKKISGNAQYIKGNRVLHHGTLLFNANLEMLSHVLAIKTDKIESKGIKSVRSRVTNICEHLPGMDMKEFRKQLEQTIITDRHLSRYEFTDADLAAIEKLRVEKYSTWEWNYGKSPDYNIKKERRFSDGGLSVYLQVTGGVIQSIRMHGDFFGNGDITDMEEGLTNTRLTEEDVTKAISRFDVGNYIFGMDAEQLTAIILH